MTYEESDELLDLVNSQDEVVGTVMREEHHAHTEDYVAKGLYFRGTGCFLVNSNQQIWVPTRQPWRKIAPDSFDFSMAEHVQSGEDYLQAAVRGMEEELNMKVTNRDLHSLGVKSFDSFGCMMNIFVYNTDHNPNFSKDDYYSAEWMSIEELTGQIDHGAKHKTALPYWLEQLRIFLAKNQ